MDREAEVNKIEEASLVMKGLLASHSDRRLEDYFHTMLESRKDLEFKMNARIDARIKRSRDRRVEKKLRSLTKRIEKLENK